MGKKGRRTKWRKLSLGDSSGPEDEEDEGVVLSGDGTWRETPPYLRSSSGGSGPGSLSPDIIRDGKRGPRYSSHSRDGYTCPVRTQCKTFGNEEYTIISTPRQEVLFKKGSIAKKRSEQNDTRPPSSQTGDETHLHDGQENGIVNCHETQCPEHAPEVHSEPPQPFMCYPVSYDMYGNVVAPYLPYGSQYPVLPTVMLQPMQWYEKTPGEQVYYYALMYPTPVIHEGAIHEDGKIIEEDEEEHVESCCRRGSISSQACCSSSLPDQDTTSISSPGTSQGPSSPQTGIATPSTDATSPQPHEYLPIADFARLTCNVSVPPPPITERPPMEVPPPPPQAGYVHPSYKIGPPSVYTVAQKVSSPIRHRSPPIATSLPPKHQQPRPPLPPGLTRRQRRNRKKRRELEGDWETESDLPSDQVTETSSQLESQTPNQNASSLAEERDKIEPCEPEPSENEKILPVNAEPIVVAEESRTDVITSEDQIVIPEIKDQEVKPDSPLPELNSVVDEAQFEEPEVVSEVELTEVESESEVESEVLSPVFKLDLPDDLPFDPAEIEHLTIEKPMEGWGCVDLGLNVIKPVEVVEAVEVETKSNHFLGLTEQGDATTPCSYVTEKLCSSSEEPSKISGDETVVVSKAFATLSINATETDDMNGNVQSVPSVITDLPRQHIGQSFPESQSPCDQSPPSTNSNSAPPLSDICDNQTEETYHFGSAAGTPYHSLFPTPVKEFQRENSEDSLEKSRSPSQESSFEADSLEDKEDNDFGEEIDEEFLFQKPKPIELWKTVILEETETETSESDNRIRTYSSQTSESEDLLRVELPDESDEKEPFFLNPEDEFIEPDVIQTCELATIAARKGEPEIVSECELEGVVKEMAVASNWGDEFIGPDVISSCELGDISLEKGALTTAVTNWLATVPPEEVLIIPDDPKNGVANPRTAPSCEDGPQRRVDENDEITSVNCSPTRYAQYYQLGVVMSDEEGESPDPIVDSGINTETSSTDSEKPTVKTNSLRKRLKSTLKRSSWRRNSKAICAEINRDEVAFEKLKRGQHCCSLQ